MPQHPSPSPRHPRHSRSAGDQPTRSGGRPGTREPQSAARNTARSIRRDLLTLAGLPGLDRVRRTYLDPAGTAA